MVIVNNSLVGLYSLFCSKLFSKLKV